MVVTGAYGRQYKNQAQVKADWAAGKDFTVVDIFHGSGTYVNREDAEQGGVKFVEVRYGKQGEKVLGLRWTQGTWK